MELVVTLRQPHRRGELFGAGDRNLRRIRDIFGVQLLARNNTIRVVGEAANVSRAARAVERMQDMLTGRDFLDDEAIDTALHEVQEEERTPGDAVTVYSRDANIVPKTEGQQHYVRCMMNSDLVFCIGPAGSGKTYLAVAVAVHMLKIGRIKRISLVRPAVEAGERLGFLPGDLQQKINPYLRPLFDAMADMMSYEQLKRFMINDVVEVIPLAYMRGRTLNNSVIILDEAQNTTPSQMLMFLTRLGHHSKMIVTGDDSQVDLEPGQPSGLDDAVHRLANVDGIDIVRLTQVDIVRHRLVSEIVQRYGVSAARRSDSRYRDRTPTPPELIERSLQESPTTAADGPQM
jgi:phosphate starvation-inducible PhoH-like protein